MALGAQRPDWYGSAGHSAAGKGPSGKGPWREFRAFTSAGQRHEETERAERAYREGTPAGVCSVQLRSRFERDWRERRQGKILIQNPSQHQEAGVAEVKCAVFQFWIP